MHHVYACRSCLVCISQLVSVADMFLILFLMHLQLFHASCCLTRDVALRLDLQTTSKRLQSQQQKHLFLTFLTAVSAASSICPLSGQGRHAKHRERLSRMHPASLFGLWLLACLRAKLSLQTHCETYCKPKTARPGGHEVGVLQRLLYFVQLSVKFFKLAKSTCTACS